MIFFVTSVNNKLYEEYGRRAFQEFDQYAGDDIQLIVKFEGNKPDDWSFSKKIQYSPLGSPSRTLFLRRFGNLKEAHGLRIQLNKGSPTGTNWSLHQDYRHNAIRFSHKVFSIIEAAETVNSPDSLVWIDADIRVLNHFDSAELGPYLPGDDQLLGYLGRSNFPKPNAYTEGGWYAFNTQHKAFGHFISDLKNLYLNGDIFSLKEWHDCWAIDTLRAEYEKRGVKFKNISGSASALEHPFINCGLGDYFDHLKGPQRKLDGRSKENDYKHHLEGSL